MSVFITPNTFLDELTKFRESGKPDNDFLQIIYPKQNSNKIFVKIKFFIQGKYQFVYILCRNLPLLYNINSLEKRIESTYLKPVMCFLGDLTVNYRINGEDILQRYGELRVTIHKLLLTKMPELQEKYPNLSEMSNAIQLERLNKETKKYELLEVPIIKTKFKILGEPQDYDSKLDIPVMDNTTVTTRLKNNKIEYIFEECHVENDDGDVEKICNGNIHKIFTSNSKVSYLEDITQAFISNGKGATFYLLANVCTNKFVRKDKNLYITTCYEEENVDNEAFSDMLKDIINTDTIEKNENNLHNINNSTNDSDSDSDSI